MIYPSKKINRRLVTTGTTGNKETDRRFVEMIQDPVKFAERVLGHRVWSKQAEILTAVAEHPRVAVKACHGSSKTFAAAEAALHWAMRHRDGIVITTAPTFERPRMCYGGKFTRVSSAVNLPIRSRTSPNSD